MERLWDELKQLREQADAGWDTTLRALEQTEQKMTHALQDGFREQRQLLHAQHEETHSRIDKAEELLIYRTR